jgi:hypothetical protein
MLLLLLLSWILYQVFLFLDFCLLSMLIVSSFVDWFFFFDSLNRSIIFAWTGHGFWFFLSKSLSFHLFSSSSSITQHFNFVVDVFLYGELHSVSALSRSLEFRLSTVCLFFPAETFFNCCFPSPPPLEVKRFSILTFVSSNHQEIQPHQTCFCYCTGNRCQRKWRGTKKCRMNKVEEWCSDVRCEYEKNQPKKRTVIK